jgi:arsenate reductase
MSIYSILNTSALNQFMTQAIIYHNPSCSKSRGAITLLEQHGIDFESIRYLENPPNYEQLMQVIDAGVSIKELIRTQEHEWKQLDIDLEQASTQDIIQAIISHPKIMQRPIIMYAGQAMIARPPEKLLELL